MPKNPSEEFCEFCDKEVPGGGCSTQHEADRCPDNYPDDDHPPQDLQGKDFEQK